jgi:hypothetical protein
MTLSECSSPSGRGVMQGHEPGYYYRFCSEESSPHIIAGGIHTGRSERSTEIDSLNCSLWAYKRSDDVPCYSNEARPPRKERSSLALDTLKTAKTGTTASTSPQSVSSCPQHHSSSSSFSNPAPKQASLNLASISLRGLFHRLGTKVDDVHKSAMQSALDISTKNDANSM